MLPFRLLTGQCILLIQRRLLQAVSRIADGRIINICRSRQLNHVSYRGAGTAVISGQYEAVSAVRRRLLLCDQGIYG